MEDENIDIVEKNDEDEFTNNKVSSENTTKIHSNSNSKPFVLDWDKLLNTNEDVIAWIRIPSTNINYPVLKGKNNDTYLRHNIYHNYARSGCIFVSEDNDVPFSDFNTIIYGHNLGNGQMFSNLKYYKDQSFYNSHKYVYIYFPNETVRKYKIVSFHTATDGDAKIYNLNVDNYKDYKKYINKNNALNNSFSFDDDDVKSVITLSTCTNVSQDRRFVVHAVLTK